MGQFELGTNVSMFDVVRTKMEILGGILNGAFSPIKIPILLFTYIVSNKPVR